MDHEKEKEKESMGLPQRNDDTYTLNYILNLPEGERAELIDGRIYEMACPSSIHQKISRQMSFEILSYIREHQGYCQLFYAPFAVFLENERTYLEPDICVICDEDKISSRGCEGAPDLVAEIVSETTQRKDYGIKLLKYRTAGVREYWIVNPLSQTVMVYFFDDESQNNQYNFSDDIPVHIFGDLSMNLASLM